MGCAGSTPKADGSSKKLKNPKPWKHTEAVTLEQLKQMREEFWDTAPHYGGQKEIWDALQAAADADLELAQTIVDSAGIIVSNSDMTVCYDERGVRLASYNPSPNPTLCGSFQHWVCPFCKLYCRCQI